jgi:hypothetical protein
MALEFIQPGEREFEPFEVDYADVSLDDAHRLAAVVDAAKDERPIQAHIASTPNLLTAHLGGGHGRWVRPQARLGSQYVADFLIAEKDSMGMHWTLVELESPKAKMCLKSGGLAQKARQAMDQIDDWRDWLGRNHTYAASPVKEQGLGLREIDPRPPGLVLVGRRDDKLDDCKRARRAAKADRRIEVHSYDWLVERVEVAARSFADLHRRAPRSR